MQSNNLENIVLDQDPKNVNTGFYIILTTDEDDMRPVYISGNFNSWRTQDKEFLMEKIANNTYHYKFPFDFEYPQELLYKFTKGDWSEVEINNEVVLSEDVLAQVNIVEQTNNELIIKLKENQTANDILKILLNNNIEISGMKEILPTINEIFIQSVNNN